MLIHIYSTGYMAHEGGYYRFFGYLNLFMFSMLTLILANNYVLMFVGWEGVGLSYLLIEVHHRGDAAAVRWSLRQVGAASALRVAAGCDGRADAGFRLIHAATMVTAGVYMVARSNALFVLAPTSMKTVAIVGALTAIFAASIGLVQNDIKRVLAYSTVSQLGYMFLALGVGAFSAGVFHVFTHAFFKALLFLGAGSVIHSMSGEQDMRNMGDFAIAFRLRIGRCWSRHWPSRAFPRLPDSSRRTKSFGRRGPLKAAPTAFFGASATPRR